MPLDILILRDPRESVRKCSLTPLHRAELDDVRFVRFHPDKTIDGGGRVLLDPEGDEITEEDRGFGLVLIDCCWRRLPRLRQSLVGELRPRRLPPLVTAYPRRSFKFDDPDAGLASIEALYAATVLLGEPRPELLTGYHFADEFLRLNTRWVETHATRLP